MPSIQIVPIDRQGRGAFNGGEIVENKPVGFPQDHSSVRPFSNLFYWAHARAVTDSTIGLHPHQGFEICSFVLKGNIRHYDTKAKTWLDLSAGDVQIIRAGSGISHAEFMAENSEMFQIWFDPNLAVTLPQSASYDDYRATDFPVATPAPGAQVTTVVGEGSPFRMTTAGVSVQRVQLADSQHVATAAAGQMFAAYVLSGAVTFNGEQARQYDFVLVKDVAELTIAAADNAEVFLMQLPAQAPYPTYAGMNR